MMKFRMNIIAALALTLAVLLTACGGGDSGTQTTTPASDGTTAAGQSSGGEPVASVTEIEDESGNFSKLDLNPVYSEASATKIAFNGGSVDITGSGAKASGSDVAITAGGTYILSGKLDDGQLTVEVAKTDKVVLILNGVTMSCSDSAPIYVKSADKTILTAVEGTVNTFSDATKYVYATGETQPNACIYSADDLTVNGSGEVSVTGNFNNGIGCKNDLKLVGATVTVSAPNNALKGNDSVRVWSGNITITKSDDAIKSDVENDPAKGFIYIAGGTLNIKAGDDGLQATNSVKILGGKVTVNAGGKSVNCDGVVDIVSGCLIEK